MAETRISGALASDLSTAMTDYSVSSESTDGATETPETIWEDDKWEQNLGYYKTIPELAAVIDAKATWTVGKGFKTNKAHSIILNGMIGWGKDTFNTILENMIRTYYIGGNAYAEIIRNKKGQLENLKPLDPGTMRHVVNSKGIIIRFEQTSRANKPAKKFKPEDIFYLARNRLADEIHGQGMVERLAEIILMKNEAMTDWKRVMHRNVDPLWIFHLDTDDDDEIAAFKTKHDNARKGGENMYIPKDVVVPEQVATATNATLSPLAWIESLDAKFYEAAQVPKIIVGGTGGITEAAVKIAYLAFQQTIEEEQLFIEEQSGIQLGVEVKLEFPASLENEMLSDNKKDGAINIDASETTAGMGQ